MAHKPRRPHYENIEIGGPVRIEPTTLEQLKGTELFLIVLMGATGAGKSAFIQSLSPHQDLQISKNTLESVTKEINFYRVVNVYNKRGGAPYVLMDTPGFLDTKLSESRVTGMITEKLNALRSATNKTQEVWVSIYYFQPITDIRMSGSKRHSVSILKAYTESFIATSINVVTTMWNMVSSPRQLEEAKKRLHNLQAEIFSSSRSLDVRVLKYEFSQRSAQSVLDKTWRGWNHYDAKTQDINRYPQYHSLILKNVINRISNTQLQIQRLSEEECSTKDRRLLKITQVEKNIAEATLPAFLYDLYEIDAETYRSSFPDLLFPPPRPNDVPLVRTFALPTRFKRLKITFSSMFNQKGGTNRL